MMRLKSAVWVSAYIRQCAVQGLMAVVERRGEDSAGAIFIKIDLLDGTGFLFAPAPQSLTLEGDGERMWIAAAAGVALSDHEIADRIARERKFDPDLWLVTVEDRAGRHLLDGRLVRG